jgi:hypothetical protein
MGHRRGPPLRNATPRRAAMRSTPWRLETSGRFSLTRSPPATGDVLSPFRRGFRPAVRPPSGDVGGGQEASSGQRRPELPSTRSAEPTNYKSRSAGGPGVRLVLGNPSHDRPVQARFGLPLDDPPLDERTGSHEGRWASPSASVGGRARANRARARGGPGAASRPVRDAARARWRRALGRVAPSRGGRRADRVTFYTALYHAPLHPNVISDSGRPLPGHGRPASTSPAASRKHGTRLGLGTSTRGQQQLVAMLDPRRAAAGDRPVAAGRRRAERLPAPVARSSRRTRTS